MTSDDAMLAMMRRDERALMRSTCTITRDDPPDDAEFDPETGRHTDTPTTVYDGPCLIRPATVTERTVLVAGTPSVVGDFLVKVPADTPAQVGDRVSVTASRDVGLVGTHLTVAWVPRDDWQVSRRLLCEEVTG